MACACIWVVSWKPEVVVARISAASYWYGYVLTGTVLEHGSSGGGPMVRAGQSATGVV